MPKKRPDPSFDPTPDQPLAMPHATASVPESWALVIVWSRTEQARAGEFALVPHTPALIGRGVVRPDDPAARLAFARHRLETDGAPAPLTAPTLSRVHVKLAAVQDGIMFERTGKGPVEHDGRPAEHGLLESGSTLLLANEILLMCERRAVANTDTSLTRTPDFPFGGDDVLHITGETAATWRLRDQARFAAGSGAPLLVTGPVGAGKGHITRAIHEASAHRDRPYVLLGGATLTRAALEALQARCDAPFVVIDEVSDVPAELQPLLARIIALTNSQPLPRMRIVATNLTPLSAAMQTAHGVRSELASRFILNVRVPGLDERRADVTLIARSILQSIAREQPEIGQRFFDDWDGERGVPRFSAGLILHLVLHRWKANVRELTSLLWTAMTNATESWLDATPEVLSQLDAAQCEGAFRDPNQLDEADVRAALHDAQGKVVIAARALGLKNRWVLYRLLERYDIKP